MHHGTVLVPLATQSLAKDIHISSCASHEFIAICDASMLVDELIKTFEFRDQGIENAV